VYDWFIYKWDLIFTIKWSIMKGNWGVYRHHSYCGFCGKWMSWIFRPAITTCFDTAQVWDLRFPQFLRVLVFWDMTLCHWINVSHFKGMYRLFLQGQTTNHWRQTLHAPSETLEILTQQHNITCQRPEYS